MAMTTDDHKAISRQMIDEVWNKGNMEFFAETIYPNAGIHDPENVNVHGGLDFAREIISMYRTAFPDIQFTVEEQVAEGDMVVTRWSARGTHLGTLGGIPPTGKQVTVTGMLMECYCDGRPRRSWMNWDGLGLMQQLGIGPSLALRAGQ
jgi:predicted ester cyclase